MSTETLETKPMTGKLFTILFFALLVIHVARNVQPCILYQADEVNPSGLSIPVFPMFTRGMEHFKTSLVTIGGLSEYVGAYFSQDMGSFVLNPRIDKLLLASPRAYSVGGTVVLGMVAVGVCVLMSRLIPRLGGMRGGLLRFLPAILLIVIWNRYTFVLAEQVALFIALLVTCLVVGIPTERPARKIVPFVGIVGLYYLAGGMAMLFAIIIGLHELCVQRRVKLGVACLACGIAVPLVIGGIAQGMPYRDAYLKLTGLNHGGWIATIAWGMMYAFFAGVAVCCGRSRNDDDSSETSPASLPGRTRVCVLIGVLVLMGVISTFTLDRKARAFRQICFYAQNHAWGPTVVAAREYMRPGAEFTSGMCRKLNRALYETDRLGGEMFAYPQRPVSGLLIGSSSDESFKSDTLLQLGLVSGSEQLARDSISTWGPRPLTYRLLLTIAQVNDDTPMAEECLDVLRADLGHKRVARQRQAYLAKGELVFPEEEASIRRIRSLRTPIRIRGPHQTRAVLESLVRQHPDDEMAFQYLMANYLLMADMEAFVANMDRVITYYEERDEPVPAHYVEALTLHCNLTGEWSDLTGVRRGAGIAECCQRFSELYRKKGDDPAVLTQILIQEMPNSYFAYYYVIFGNREVSQDS